MFSQLLVAAIVIVPITFVAFNRVRSDVAALWIVVALAAAQWAGLGVLGKPETPGDSIKSLTGFAQPVVMTLISLFFILRALEKSGGTRWLARRLLALGGVSESRLVFLFTSTTALLSLFMNNLAAGALMLPSAIEVSRRTGIRASRLLVPVAFGSLLGGAATYFTTANIIVSDLLPQANPPQMPLHILDFTATGGLIALTGIFFIAIFGKWLLPNREPQVDGQATLHTGSELEALYQLHARLWEARVVETSAVQGKTLSESRIGKQLGISVVAIKRGSQNLQLAEPSRVLRSGDTLIVIGREERVLQLAGADFGFQVTPAEQKLSVCGITFVEVVVAPRSAVLGHSLKEIGLRSHTGFTAVALYRGERSYRTDVGDFKLEFGDSLLLSGPQERLGHLQRDADFITLEPDLSDHPALRGPAVLTVGIIACAIGASVAGVPTYLAMLTAAMVVILLGLVTISEAYRSMEWSSIFLVGGMAAAGTAMVNTGLAQLIGQGVVSIVAPFGPMGLAAGGFLLSAALTQAMGGQVSILVTGPIAISAAISLHANPQAIAVATAIGCSAAFLTPMAHPVNALVMAPGNYRFGDFARMGWVLMLLSFAMMLIGMKLFWRL